MRAGDGLCDEAAVRVLVEEGPRYVRELIDWGARFDRDADGRTGARPRGGAQRAARAARRRCDRPRDRPRAVGAGAAAAVGRDDRSRARHRARRRARAASPAFGTSTPPGVATRCAPAATLLATGGAGQVFRETTNPAVATGDGIALALPRRRARRRSRVRPVPSRPRSTWPGAPRFLISEALRGEGARLVNARGEPFMTAVPPRRRSRAARRRRPRHRARVGARPAARVS